MGKFFAMSELFYSSMTTIVDKFNDGSKITDKKTPECDAHDCVPSYCWVWRSMVQNKQAIEQLSKALT